VKTSFNLIEKAWIPCLLPGGEIPRELGIRDVLVRAAEIREIVDASPLVTASLHRLLLAILHRNFGPADAGCWADLWRRGRFDEAPVDAYLTEWASRFDLFDDRRPFYQVASLDFQYAVPIARLAHELTRDTSNALFNHTASDADGMPPAKAARYLVAHQAFALGGLVSLERGQNPALYKSADAAPLTKGAVCLVKGRNLFETLMLNLHRYNREDASPFDFDGEDLPTWERSDETRAGDRWPRGYLDLLTWQSRRIRLRAEETESGEIVVRGDHEREPVSRQLHPPGARDDARLSEDTRG
jgi:CRISPR system Cascade subunit CasA